MSMFTRNHGMGTLQNIYSPNVLATEHLLTKCLGYTCYSTHIISRLQNIRSYNV